MRWDKALSDDADFEYILVDSTIVRAHQHSAGAPKKAIDPKLGLKLTRSDGQKAA
jgi:putative transposase